MGELTRLTASIELNNVQFKSAVDETKRKKKELRDSTKKTGKEVSKFGNLSRTTARNVAVLQGPLGGVSSRLSSIASIAGSGVNPAMIAAGAAITAVSFAVYQSLQAWSAAERSQLRIQALLKSTGSAAGLTASELEDMAFRVGRDTLASTEGIRKAQGILLSFKTVQGDTFTRSIELSQDLAEVMGTDVSQSALQLGKALESPTIGLTALRRSGVSFTESERDLIKELESTGQVAAAQTLILDKLQSQIGGAGAGAGGGLAGRVDLLTEYWARLLESLGEGAPGEVAGGVLDTLSAGLEKVLGLVNPSLEVEFDRLYDERAALQERINDLQTKADGRGDSGFLDLQLNQLKERSAEVEARYGDVVTRIQARNEEKNQAVAASEKAATQAEIERADAQLKIAQEKGVKTLAMLQQRLTSEDLQQKMAHEKRLADIATLQVSETELRRAGFESLAALRAEYRERELLEYEEERELKAERQATEIQDEVDANNERLRRIEAGIADFELKQAADKKDAAKAKMDIDNAVADNAIGLGKVLFKEGSAAHKLALIAEKAVAIIRIRMNTQAAVAAALAVDPTGATAISARIQGGLALAEVLSTSIAGIAHGGLSNVPKEGTYLLDKGERVLSPNQNDDLKSFLKGNAGGGAGSFQVIVNEAPGVSTRSQMLDGVLTIDMIREDLANGGEISRALTETHSVERLATRG